MDELKNILKLRLKYVVRKNVLEYQLGSSTLVSNVIAEYNMSKLSNEVNEKICCIVPYFNNSSISIVSMQVHFIIFM